MASNKTDEIETTGIENTQDKTMSEYAEFLRLKKKYESSGEGTSFEGGDLSEDAEERKRKAREAEEAKREQEKEEKETLKLLTMMKQMTYNKIQTPIFKGEKTEDPSTHLLKVNDWFEAEYIDDALKTKQFKLTLEGKARQWYDDITVPALFTDLTRMFLRQFSIMGRSRKQLHEKWRSLNFDPNVQEVDSFIKEVKQTAKQMGYGDDAVLDCLKCCRPGIIPWTMVCLRTHIFLTELGKTTSQQLMMSKI